MMMNGIRPAEVAQTGEGLCPPTDFSRLKKKKKKKIRILSHSMLGVHEKLQAQVTHAVG